MIGLYILIFLLLLAFSLRWNWWRLPKPGIPVLMYHKIGDPPVGSKLKKLWVSVERFRRQMDFLKKEGYTPITFVDLYRHWDSATALPAKPIVLTFDDGYKNNHDLAHPVLREFGFSATLFVVTNTVGADNKWHDPASETRISMLSWDELKKLKNENWEIGSHTLNHPRLTRLELGMVATEMQASRAQLETFLGTRPDTFAYPYGDGEDVVAIRESVRRAGYRIAVGVHAGKWTLDKIKASPFNLPRVFVRGDENMLDFSLQLSRGKSRF